MNTKQKVSIITPVVLMGMMYPVFHLLAGAFEENRIIAWYLGLMIYWVLWGGLFPYLIIGKESIRRIIRPQKLDIKRFFLVVLPLLLAALYRIISGMEYQKPCIRIFVLLASTNFGNGFFEEVLWRGVYMELFPNSIPFRIVWPSIWFALRHYAPGSISPSGNQLGLMIGSGLMGFYLSFLAKKPIRYGGQSLLTF